MYNLISFAGIFILMAFAWVLSTNRKVINWRVVIWGTLLQLIFTMFIFIVPAGSKIFLLINDAVVKVLDCATAGTRFLFGRLALPLAMKNNNTRFFSRRLSGADLSRARRFFGFASE